MSESNDIAGIIQQKSLDLGFSACGFAMAGSLEEFGPDYREWLSAGKAGEMEYLAKNVEVRLDPAKLVNDAKTIISLAAGYYFPMDLPVSGQPRISNYALGEDYHVVLKSMGKELLGFISEKIGPVHGRVFTDSAPVFEREWARRSGLGWIGKNGCLIVPHLGSWLFLAEIIIDREIKAGTTLVPDRCGSCNRCIAACPTGALGGDGSMDPRKCISYLTIEHRGDIPEEFRGKWDDWIFGCDICQDVCPWNHDPVVSAISRFQPRPGLVEEATLFFRNPDTVSFGQIFDGTPVMRAGRSGILRNFEFLKRMDSNEVR